MKTFLSGMQLFSLEIIILLPQLGCMCKTAGIHRCNIDITKLMKLLNKFVYNYNQ